MGFSSSSLRIRLMLLVCITVAPALGLIYYTASEQWEFAAKDAQADALRLVHALSAEHERLIESGHQLLIGLSKLPQVTPHEGKSCSAIFSDVMRESSAFTSLTAAKPDGEVFCSSSPNLAAANFLDRAYFQKALKTRNFTVSDFVIGRISKKPIVTLSYPSIDAQGELRAVLVLGFDLSVFNRVVAEARLPSDSTVSVIDRNGVILARTPDPDSSIGKAAPERSLVDAVMARQEGTSEAVGVDRVARLYAYTRLRGMPEDGKVYVWVGIPKKQAFSSVDRLVAVNFIGLALVLVLMTALAWWAGHMFILRHVNALLDATKKLSSGDFHARVASSYEPGELGQLARSFDAMAESLERRYRQMKALHEIDVAINSTLDIHEILQILLEKIDLCLPYAVTTVRLLNKDTGELESFACRNVDEREWKAVTAKSGGGLRRMLPDGNTPLVVKNAQTDPRSLSSEFVKKYGLVSFLRVPLTVKDNAIGVLTFFTREEHEFSSDEVDFLVTLAGQAAIAIHNSQLYEQIKSQAAELQTSNQVKNEFLSVMSHELRTPLNIIMGYAGIVREQLLGDINEKQDEALSKVIVHSQDLLKMISEILQTTSIEARAVKIDPVEVDVAEFFADLRSNYELLRTNGVDMVWDCASAPRIIETDGEKLKHVLQNLINNALKFTPKGRITISARPDDQDGLKIAVADTGVGISEEALRYIFDKFRQADSSETRRFGGVGMGLYIAKGLTEFLGGRIEVESELGRGTTFTVTLPCQATPRMADQTAPGYHGTLNLPEGKTERDRP